MTTHIDDDRWEDAVTAAEVELIQSAEWINEALSDGVMDDKVVGEPVVSVMRDEMQVNDGWDALNVLLRAPAGTDDHQAALMLLRGLLNKRAAKDAPALAIKRIEEANEQAAEDAAASRYFDRRVAA